MFNPKAPAIYQDPDIIISPKKQLQGQVFAPCAAYAVTIGNDQDVLRNIGHHSIDVREDENQETLPF